MNAFCDKHGFHDCPISGCPECKAAANNGDVSYSETTERIILTACPFCDGKNLLHGRGDIGNLHWVFCKSCRAEGPVAMSWDEAVGLWNMRNAKTSCPHWDHEEQECAD